jgi:hypothetical protein
MSFDRSLDDLPLAAYGGSGMELTADDEAKLDVAPPTEADSLTVDPEHPAPAAPVAPGPFAHATGLGPALEGEPRPARPIAPMALALATRGVTLLRTSRVAQGAAFVAVIAVGVLMLLGGGSNPGAASAAPSPSAPVAVAPTREPGNATLVLTGEVEQEVSFTTSTGTGGPSAPLSMTWSDPAANSLGLDGPVDRGTRSTAETLVLQWTVMVDEKPVTFTSTDGECTLGMGIVGTRVQGTFSCKRLKSDDGKYVVGATGTYRT